MANTSIFAAFERLWQHTLAKLSNYVTLDIFNTQQTNIEELSTNVAYINKEDNENIENPDVEMTSVIVDAALSTTSINPVQNKVISEKINELTLTINDKDSLPTVTTENNGQVLMVVGGAWVAATIENAEGGSF